MEFLEGYDTIHHYSELIESDFEKNRLYLGLEISRLAYAGYQHLDLHWGNIMYNPNSKSYYGPGSRGKFIIIDYGRMKKVDQPDMMFLVNHSLFGSPDPKNPYITLVDYPEELNSIHKYRDNVGKFLYIPKFILFLQSLVQADLPLQFFDTLNQMKGVSTTDILNETIESALTYIVYPSTDLTFKKEEWLGRKKSKRRHHRSHRPRHRSLCK